MKISKNGKILNVFWVIKKATIWYEYRSSLTPRYGGVERGWKF